MYYYIGCNLVQLAITLKFKTSEAFKMIFKVITNLLEVITLFIWFLLSAFPSFIFPSPSYSFLHLLPLSFLSSIFNLKWNSFDLVLAKES